MKTRSFLLVLACAACGRYLEDGHAIGLSSQRMAYALPAFSDSQSYNSFDHCGSPLGLLEDGQDRVQLELGYRYLKFHDRPDSIRSAASSFASPVLTIGMPRIIRMRLAYAPMSAYRETKPSPANSLPLHRYGLIVAGGVASGIFRAGLSASGYNGVEELEGSDNSRLLMGVEDLSVHLGTQLHELVRLGLHGGVCGDFDSLRDFTTLHQDRYFSGSVPVIGFNIDFGADEFPFLGNFSFASAKNRFIYVAKTGHGQATGNDRPEGNEDPIKGDSIAWDLAAMADLKRSEWNMRPAVNAGYWRNHSQAYAPVEDNNDPITYGPERDGKDWKVSSLYFGFGGSMVNRRYGMAYFEYAHSNLGLEYGSLWPLLKNKKWGYDRFGLGLEGDINSIPGLPVPQWVELSARLGYLNMRENSTVNSFRGRDFSLLYPVRAGSQRFRDDPDFGVGPDQRIINITMGLGSAFAGRMIVLDANAGFLTKITDTKYSGFEFGVDITYYLKAAE
jgi:hypothetical protein